LRLNFLKVKNLLNYSMKTAFSIFIEVTNIPETIRQVFYIYYVECYVNSDYSFIWVIGSKKTSDIAFYSGELVDVELEIEYKRFLDNLESITVNSIVV